MAKAWMPVKGGDGGVAPRHAAGVDRLTGKAATHARDNARVYAHPAAESDPQLRAGMVPTTDPFDRAHGMKLGGRLVPAATVVNGRVVPTVPAAKPRLYHPTEMCGSVTFETAFHEHYERRRRVNAVLGTPARRERTLAEARADAMKFMDRQSFEALSRPRLRQRISPAELALERAASRLLRAGGT